MQVNYAKLLDFIKILKTVYTNDINEHIRVYPKVSGLDTWSENCKWDSSLPLGAVVSLLCESV
jgi:hypothetical protein